MPSNHLILCHPRLLLPSIFPSIKVFSSESVLHIKWPKYRSYSFGISPSNGCAGLISFRMDCLDLLASKGLSRVFSNTTVQEHQFLGAQPFLWSNSHIHTWLLEKTIVLTRQTFVGKVRPLLFNTRSRFVIAVNTDLPVWSAEALLQYSPISPPSFVLNCPIKYVSVC